MNKIQNSHWHSFFWVFGILMFGANISDMIAAQKIDGRFTVFVLFACCAAIHGLYKRYKAGKAGVAEQA